MGAVQAPIFSSCCYLYISRPIVGQFVCVLVWIDILDLQFIGDIVKFVAVIAVELRIQCPAIEISLQWRIISILKTAVSSTAIGANIGWVCGDIANAFLEFLSELPGGFTKIVNKSGFIPL